MFTLIRKKLLLNPELLGLLDNKESIFLVEKPEEEKYKNWNPYVIYKYKPLSKGYIKDYQIEFNIISKDLRKAICIQEKITEILDNPRNIGILKDDNTVIRSIEQANGGGMIKNPETGSYEIVLFFIAKV
jgi:hypothetical protein